MVDDSQLQAGIAAFKARLRLAVPVALMRTADKVLLESQKQVPLDTGWLQNSGEVEIDGDGVVLGYHAPYAAYQHEGVRADGSHVVHNWQHGRKKKYITDPIQENGSVLLEIFGKEIQTRVLS